MPCIFSTHSRHTGNLQYATLVGLPRRRHIVLLPRTESYSNAVPLSESLGHSAYNQHHANDSLQRKDTKLNQEKEKVHEVERRGSLEETRHKLPSWKDWALGREVREKRRNVPENWTGASSEIKGRPGLMSGRKWGKVGLEKESDQQYEMLLTHHKEWRLGGTGSIWRLGQGQKSG